MKKFDYKINSSRNKRIHTKQLHTILNKNMLLKRVMKIGKMKKKVLKNFLKIR